MKRNKSIKFKAALLLIVFSLNTIAGIACAVGMDMGFNTFHHHEEKAIEPNKESIHHHDKSNYQDEAGIHHHKSNGDKDNCCNDKVVIFNQLNKALPPSINFVINPIFFTPFLASFYNIDILSSFGEVSNIKYFLLSYHPPIPDIRIAIQSFQI